MGRLLPNWDIPSSWRPALAAARSGGVLFLVGAADSGKSTLAAVLADEALRADRSTAVVDADVGQSSIGPPACVGMATPGQPFGSLDMLEPEAMDFVGACSPKGHLLQCATSASRMAAAARASGAETLILDTTGMVSGPSARALKGAKIRLVDPDFVIALQVEDEAEHLVGPYRSRSRPQVLSLSASRSAKERSRDERAVRRQQKLGAYFSRGGLVELLWDRTPIENSAWTSGTPAPGHVRAHAEECLAREVLYAERRADGLFVITAGQADAADLRRLGEGFEGGARAVDAAALENLLVGLLGSRGETLGLGILERSDFRERGLAIYTPVNDCERIRGIRLGALQVARDGTQLAYHEPGTVG
jgi:polynucleotide 5'-hydroxyl-kinase GRC3/NOL9